MVEILKKGIPPAERKYTIDCNHCGTKFRFQKKEAKFNADQRDGNFLTIDCPVCDKLCSIDDNKFDVELAYAHNVWDR